VSCDDLNTAIKSHADDITAAAVLDSPMLLLLLLLLLLLHSMNSIHIRCCVAQQRQQQ